MHNNCEGELNQFCNLVSVPDIMKKIQLKVLNFTQFSISTANERVKKNCYSWYYISESAADF